MMYRDHRRENPREIGVGCTRCETDYVRSTCGRTYCLISLRLIAAHTSNATQLASAVTYRIAMIVSALIVCNWLEGAC